MIQPTNTNGCAFLSALADIISILVSNDTVDGCVKRSLLRSGTNPESRIWRLKKRKNRVKVWIGLSIHKPFNREQTRIRVIIKREGQRTEKKKKKKER